MKPNHFALAALASFLLVPAATARADFGSRGVVAIQGSQPASMACAPNTVFLLASSCVGLGRSRAGSLRLG